MTVEEIALEIKQGNTEYIDELWLLVENFIKMQANSFYQKFSSRCCQIGVGTDDLIQVGFFALNNAVKAYTSDYKFLTYLSHQLKNQFYDLTKMHASGWQNNTIYNAFSLDTPITDDSEHTQWDLVPDPSAEQDVYAFIDEDEKNELKENVHKAIKTLADKERYLINQYFFVNSSISDIAKRLNVSAGRANDIKKQALTHLRKSKYLKKYEHEKKEIEDKYSFGFSFKKFKETGMSSQEMYVIKLDELKSRYGIK